MMFHVDDCDVWQSGKRNELLISTNEGGGDRHGFTIEFAGAYFLAQNILEALAVAGFKPATLNNDKEGGAV